jgi:hypothetical protein
LQQSLGNLVYLSDWFMVVAAYHVLLHSLQLAMHLIDVVEDLFEVLGLFFSYAVRVFLLGFRLLFRLVLFGFRLLLAHKYYNFGFVKLYFDL